MNETTEGWEENKDFKRIMGYLKEGEERYVIDFIRTLKTQTVRETVERAIEIVKDIIAEHEHDSEFCGAELKDCVEMTESVAIYNTACRDAYTALASLISLEK